LFDVSETSSLMPISLSYLGAGGIGFVGSTTIAYGPAKGNGAADLLTQYFLIEILAGASLGRAFLQARQKFIQTQRLADPVNLKTIAQFILLGDPSVHPCPAEPAAVPGTLIAKTMPTSAGDPAARADRRMELIALGKATALASAFLGKRIVRPRKTLENLVREIAGEKHFRIDSLAAFEVSGGPIYREAMKLQEATAKVFVLASNLADGAKAIAKSGGAAQKEVTEGARGVTLMRILVAHAHDDRIVQVAEYVSR
jgi:hypothetical protein